MASYDEMAPEEAQPRLDEFCPVDVRAEHEFRGPLGHVPGALLIPLLELEDRLGEIPSDRPPLLICRSGKRSGDACEILSERGLAAAVNLSGGMIAWNRARLPVDPCDPESLAELLALATAWLAQVGPLTPAAACEVVTKRLERHGVAFDQPTHTAVESAIDFIEELLTPIAPPDLDLSIDSFRRSLTVL